MLRSFGSHLSISRTLSAGFSETHEATLVHNGGGEASVEKKWTNIEVFSFWAFLKSKVSNTNLGVQRHDQKDGRKEKILLSLIDCMYLCTSLFSYRG